MLRSIQRFDFKTVTITLIGVILTASLTAGAEVLTLDEAIYTALGETSRGEMIEASLEVAEQNYFARRINFYLPEISIKGSLPAYSVDESYRFFGGATEKKLYKTRDIDFNSFIELKQSLVTGGDVVVTANLTARDEEYPNTRPDVETSAFINEETRRGYFTFSYSQPLLKPSDSRNRYNNSRDDYEIAELVKVEDETSLRKEVVEAYIGVLQQDLQAEIKASQFGARSFTARIDSIKLEDGVISEEDWLLSASNRLDAELDSVQAVTERAQKRRDLKNIIEWDISKQIEVSVPAISHISTEKTRMMLTNWDRSIPVEKAELEYEKAKRTADFAASGHGLTGDLTANYSTGQLLRTAPLLKGKNYETPQTLP